MMIVPVILIFSITATISACVLHHHNHCKVFVGSVRLVASVAMYSSHLVVMVSSFPPIAPTVDLFNIKLPNLVNVEKLCLVRISSCMHIQLTLDTIHIAKAFWRGFIHLNSRFYAMDQLAWSYNQQWNGMSSFYSSINHISSSTEIATQKGIR